MQLRINFLLKKSLSAVARSKEGVMSNVLSVIPFPKSATTERACQISHKPKMIVSEFSNVAQTASNPIRANLDDIKIIYDLYKNNEVPKINAFEGIKNLTDKSIGLKYVPKLEYGLRGYYGQYIEFSHTIQPNETMNLDMMVSQYLHEYYHVIQTLEVNRTIPIEKRIKSMVEARAMRRNYRSDEEYNKAIKRAQFEWLKAHNDAGWNNIISEYPPYEYGSTGYNRGMELFKAESTQDGLNLDNLWERQAYTAGTSAYIEIQKSVHGNINKKEYDILNDINVRLHQNYSLLSPEYKKLADNIGINPQTFVENVKYIVEEIGISNSDEVIKCLIQLL